MAPKFIRQLKTLLLTLLLLVLIIVVFRIISVLKWPKPKNFSRPDSWAQKEKSDVLQNFYKVNDHIYRSKQPNAEGMAELASKGFKTIVNLRHYKKDNDLAVDTGLILQHLPINTFTLSKKELAIGIEILRKAEKPILVHCLHGSDRTGALIAAYRIVELGWTKEDAISELKFGGYGYHQIFFPNILWTLNSLKNK